MFKKILSLIVLTVVAFGMNAQTITGTVTDLNNSGIGNHQVFIMSNDSTNPYSASVFTIGSGAYSFYNVPSSSMGFTVYTYDCQQSYQSVVLATNSGVADFSICTSNPTACAAAFLPYPDSLNANIINFVDLSIGSPTSWTWSFGDGSSSSIQNPSHTYASAGTYNVNLIISSASCTDSINMSVVVGNTPPSCTADFYYFADSLSTNNISFFDVSTGNPTSWSWDFGDGTTSTSQNPFHIFTSGTYNVTLAIASANCSDTYSQTVVIGGANPSYYSLSGAISANNVPITEGMAVLFDVSTSALTSIVMVDASGMYYFNNVAAGTYYVLGVNDSTLLPGFVATYYGDVAFWSAATAISVNANLTGLDINLIAIPSTPGNGSISGNVGTGSKTTVENLSVLLTDDNNSDALIASTFTNVDGDYTFVNVADGTFNIWVEIPGKTATPITVIIEDGNATSTDNDFVIDGNTITPKPASIANNSIDGELSIYPNPVSNVLNIELNLEKEGNFSFNIYSISGQLISSKSINVNSGNTMIKINTNNLSQGTYILRVESSTNQSLQKMFVK